MENPLLKFDEQENAIQNIMLDLQDFTKEECLDILQKVKDTFR